MTIKPTSSESSDVGGVNNTMASAGGERELTSVTLFRSVSSRLELRIDEGKTSAYRSPTRPGTGIHSHTEFDHPSRYRLKLSSYY